MASNRPLIMIHLPTKSVHAKGGQGQQTLRLLEGMSNVPQNARFLRRVFVAQNASFFCLFVAKKLLLFVHAFLLVAYLSWTSFY